MGTVLLLFYFLLLLRPKSQSCTLDVVEPPCIVFFFLQFLSFAKKCFLEFSQYFSMSHLLMLVHLFVLKCYSNNILVDNMQNSEDVFINVYVYI